MWKVEDSLPISDAKRLGMFEWRNAEHFQAVKLRGSAISQGGKRHFLTENRERANYASLDYTPRLEVIGGENEEVNGILIEWAEVRLEDDCAQTLLKIQILTNVMQRLLDGE